ncbi:MAG: hypothetical protein KUG65_00875 [Sphingomonadaceae bacterium]|nr:hypothetical protein [Sphingomonadaceae bacterium]
MSRPKPVIPVTPKMYRHFAMITLAITGCLAMFADGENRQAVEQHLSDQKQMQDMRRAGQKIAANGKGGNNRLNFRDNRKNKGTFGTGSDVSYSSNSTKTSGAGSASFSNAERGGGAQIALVDERSSVGGTPLPEMLPPGMTLEEYREMLLQKKKKKARKKASKPDLDAIIAASAARSRTREY